MSSNSKNPNGITILIATYNGASRIGETIAHIGAQEGTEEFGCELIVIDNASRDDTAAVAETACAQLPENIPFRILHQPVPGKNAALEMGYAEARYEYVLICDDDNFLAPDYLKTGFRIMEAIPLIGALGGLGVAVFEEEAPPWCPDGYACGPQGSRSGDISDITKGERCAVFGAGCIYRMSALDRLRELGFENILSTRRGQKVDASGEDYELCHALALAGYKIWYDERLVFRHLMPASRMTVSKLLSLRRGDGVQDYVLRLYTKALRRRSMSNLYLVRFWVKSLYKATIATVESNLKYLFKRNLKHRCQAACAKYRLLTVLDLPYCVRASRKFMKFWRQLKANHYV